MFPFFGILDLKYNYITTTPITFPPSNPPRAYVTDTLSNSWLLFLHCYCSLLLTPFSVACVCNFRAYQLVLFNQSVGSSLEKTISPNLSIPWLPKVLRLGMGPIFSIMNVFKYTVQYH